MIKKEHTHGKVTHSHYGGDVKHKHEAPDREPRPTLEHWHTNERTGERILHAHKGGDVYHDHTPERNELLVDYVIC